MGVSSEFVKEGFAIATNAALELGKIDEAERLIASIEKLPPGKYPQLLRAQGGRFKARIASLHGDAADAERSSEARSASSESWRCLSISPWRS